MKKLIIISFVLLCLTKSYACDICGCGVGGNYIGILPEFNKHIIGIRYRYNSMLTHVGLGGTNTYLTTTEVYRTTELWGGWNIGKKFRIMAAIPYAFNEKVNQGLTETINGLGDISVNGFFQLLNSSQKVRSNKLFVQSLWIGGGVKLPTGKYSPDDKQNISKDANLFQLGSGSVDFSVNAMYDIRLQDFGVNISAGYKMNTTNQYNYCYGDKLNTTLQTYYKFRVMKMFTVSPNAGLLYENSQKDIYNSTQVDISGGSVLLGTIGLETSGKRISLGGNWQSPLSQNMANGVIKANNRVMLHVSFNL